MGNVSADILQSISLCSLAVPSPLCREVKPLEAMINANF